MAAEDRRGESGSYGTVNYASTLSVAEPFASLVFTVSAPQSRCASGEVCCISVNLQYGILVTSKKQIHGNGLVPRPNSYSTCACRESKSPRVIKAPKDEMGPAVITGNSSWALLICLYLHALLFYLQVLVVS